MDDRLTPLFTRQSAAVELRESLLHRLAQPQPFDFADPGEFLAGEARRLCLLAGLVRLQPLGMLEDILEKLARVAMSQVLQHEFVLRLNRVGPVGVDAKALGVRDYQQGRVLQRHRIELQLLVSAIEIGTVLLVLPAEMPTLPNVGEAGRAIYF